MTSRVTSLGCPVGWHRGLEYACFKIFQIGHLFMEIRLFSRTMSNLKSEQFHIDKYSIRFPKNYNDYNSQATHHIYWRNVNSHNIIQLTYLSHPSRRYFTLCTSHTQSHNKPILQEVSLGSAIVYIKLLPLYGISGTLATTLRIYWSPGVSLQQLTNDKEKKG